MTTDTAARVPLTRYEDSGGRKRVIEHPHGRYVLYEDARSLEAQLAEAQRLVEFWKTSSAEWRASRERNLERAERAEQDAAQWKQRATQAAELLELIKQDKNSLRSQLEAARAALRPFAAMRLSTEDDEISNGGTRSKELQELMEWRDKPIREARALLANAAIQSAAGEGK